MRYLLCKTFLAGVTTLVLFTVPVFAHDHKNLNGTWNLIPTRSDFAGQPAIETGTVTINDREHNIYVSRNFSYDGKRDMFSYSFSTDGRENSTIHNGQAFKSKARWDGDVLKVVSAGSVELGNNKKVTGTKKGTVFMAEKVAGEIIK